MIPRIVDCPPPELTHCVVSDEREVTKLQHLQRAVRDLVGGRESVAPKDLRAIPGELTRIFAELALGRFDLPDIAVDPARRWGVMDLTPERGPDFAIRAFRWLPGSSTSRHDHPAADPRLATVMFFARVLSGDLREDAYTETRRGHLTTSCVRRLAAGQETFAHASGRPYIHRVQNPGIVEAYSIHVYVPAIEHQSMRDYEPAAAEVTAYGLAPTNGHVKPTRNHSPRPLPVLQRPRRRTGASRSGERP